MAEMDVETSPEAAASNGHDPLETRLRLLFAEQRRLRERLERPRTELDRGNREELQVQDEVCTDADREEEYGRCLQRMLGIDQHFDPKSIAEATTGGQTMGELIEDLERKAGLSSQEVR